MSWLPLPGRPTEGLADTLRAAQMGRSEMLNRLMQQKLAQAAESRAQQLFPSQQKELTAKAELEEAQAAKAKRMKDLMDQYFNSPSSGASPNGVTPTTPSVAANGTPPNGSSVPGNGTTPSVSATSSPVSAVSGSNKQKLRDFLISTGAIKATPGETAEAEASAKAKVKRKQDLIAIGETINKYAPNYQTIDQLLKTDANTTGNIAGVRNMLHLGSEDQGKFNGAATPILGKMAKDISQRGGAAAANFATQGKPSIWNSTATNMGLVKQNVGAAVDAYNEAKNSYEKEFGEKYPVSLHNFYANYGKGDRTNVTSPFGKIISFPSNQVDAFLKDHPDHKKVSP